MCPVASLWQLNGDKNVGWHIHNWPETNPDSDNLAVLTSNTLITIKLPIVNDGNDKILYILTRGFDGENISTTNYKLFINGTLIESFKKMTNIFSRYYDSKQYLLYFGTKIPATLIKETSITVTIDTTNNGNVYFREMGTHNF